MAASPSTSRSAWLAGLVLVVISTVVLVAGARRSIPPEKICPDFIQFWTAASALSEGRDPYEPAWQARVQRELGWQREKDGYGVYDFLPYYYPPWLGLAFLPMLPLGYGLAKLTWLVLGAEMLLASGWLLRSSVRSVSPAMAVAVAVFFAFALKAVAMGQVAPLVLLLLAATWRLLDSRRDVLAGCAMALLTIKPQLTVIALAALLGWTAVQQRWGTWKGFVATLGGLGLVSTLFFPGWLPSMLAATRVTPMPTAYYPGLGATWYVALEAVGLRGVALHAAYLAIVVPLLLAVLRMAVRPQTRLDDLLALTLLAPFFVAPYARSYDFPILFIPALVLLGRLPELGRFVLAMSLTLLPALHLMHQTASYAVPVVGVRRPEFWYFWIPLLIGGVWVVSKVKREQGEPAAAAT